MEPVFVGLIVVVVSILITILARSFLSQGAKPATRSVSGSTQEKPTKTTSTTTAQTKTTQEPVTAPAVATKHEKTIPSDAAFYGVDMRKEYDEALLTRFYNDLMVPNFGQFDSELEALDVWLEQFKPPKEGEENEFTLHVFIAFGKDDQKKETIVGGVAFEYYPKSNCGLMTYIAVNPKFFRKGVGHFLVKNVLEGLHADAKAAGKGLCDAVFLETNDAAKVDKEKDVMDPLVRHKVLHNLGFQILDFYYVQPALGPGQEKCTDLLLAIHKSFLSTKDDVVGISSKPVIEFLREFFTVLAGEEALATDTDVARMEEEAKEKPHVPLSSTHAVHE